MPLLTLFINGAVDAKGEYEARLTYLEDDTIEVGPGPLKMSFSSSGQLQSMTNYITGVSLFLPFYLFIYYSLLFSKAIFGFLLNLNMFRLTCQYNNVISGIVPVQATHQTLRFPNLIKLIAIFFFS